MTIYIARIVRFWNEPVPGWYGIYIWDGGRIKDFFGATILPIYTIFSGKWRVNNAKFLKRLRLEGKMKIKEIFRYFQGLSRCRIMLASYPSVSR